MNRVVTLAAIAIAAGALSGCTTEELSRNVYEGARVHNESLKSTPLENPRTEPTPYDQYEKERRDGGTSAPASQK
jgi:hypothetical protein